MDKYRHQRSPHYVLALAVAWLVINLGMLLFQYWPTTMKVVAGAIFIFLVIPLALGQAIRKNN